MTSAPSLPAAPFGTTPAGSPAQVFTLESDALRVRITDFGGRMVSIEAPDRAGQRGHVLLGFKDAETFGSAGGSFGTLLGRYANRIGGGFTLDGTHVELPATSEGGVTSHGGPHNFSRVVWQVVSATGGATPELVLRHVSPDGDQGFPGELTATATYRVEGDSLSLTLEASTTRPTVVNLAVHPYFNLRGTAAGDCLDHVITIPAKHYLPTDKRQIPTGEIAPVFGTVFDFTTPQAFAARIRQPDAQLLLAGGYDHCFVTGEGPSAEPILALRAEDPESGRVMELYTQQPGVQVYTGNKLVGYAVGQEGVVYRQAAGFAVEPQNLPDAPNKPNFPSAVLRPGEAYSRTSRYRFTTA